MLNTLKYTFTHPRAAPTRKCQVVATAILTLATGPPMPAPTAHVYTHANQFTPTCGATSNVDQSTCATSCSISRPLRLSNHRHCVLVTVLRGALAVRMVLARQAFCGDLHLEPQIHMVATPAAKVAGQGRSAPVA